MSQGGRQGRGKSKDGPKDDGGDYWVQCGKCKDWVRYDLSGLPLPYDEEAVKKTKFNCKICLLTLRLQEITSETTELKTRIERLETATTKGQTWADIVKTPEVICKLRSKLTSLGDKLISNQEQTPPVENLTGTQLRQATDEINELDRRKMNLIIFGLPESDDNKNKFVDFMNASCNVSIQINDVVSAERLGRPHAPDRPRILRIKFATAWTRRKCLIARQVIPQGENPKIFVRPDLTKTQQELDKKLREEWMTKGRDTHMIHRGKVILRPGLNSPIISTSTAPGTLNTKHNQTAPMNLMTAGPHGQSDEREGGTLTNKVGTACANLVEHSMRKETEDATSTEVTTGTALSVPSQTVVTTATTSNPQITSSTCTATISSITTSATVSTATSLVATIGSNTALAVDATDASIESTEGGASIDLVAKDGAYDVTDNSTFSSSFTGTNSNAATTTGPHTAATTTNTSLPNATTVAAETKAISHLETASCTTLSIALNSNSATRTATKISEVALTPIKSPLNSASKRTHSQKANASKAKLKYKSTQNLKIASKSKNTSERQSLPQPLNASTKTKTKQTPTAPVKTVAAAAEAISSLAIASSTATLEESTSDLSTNASLENSDVASTSSISPLDSTLKKSHKEKTKACETELKYNTTPEMKIAAKSKTTSERHSLPQPLNSSNKTKANRTPTAAVTYRPNLRNSKVNNSSPKLAETKKQPATRTKGKGHSQI